MDSEIAVAGSGAADRIARLVIAALVVLAVFYLNFRFVLVHFSSGGDLLDSGWFAWIMASGDPWLTSPRAISDISYFNYHLAPYLSGLSIVVHATGIGRFTAFALHQGLMFAVLAGSLCALALQSWSGGRSALLFAAVALFMLVGDVILQIASFPHYEIAIPAFCTLGAALWLRGQRALGALAFALTCLVREDGGLYAAAFLFGLAALRPFGTRLLTSAEVLGAAGAIAISLLMFTIKTLYFPGFPTFASNFSGESWNHVTPAFVLERSFDLLRNPHALTALLTAAILAVTSPRYLAFPVLLAPVILAQGLAVRDQLGHFMAYYATPFVVIWVGLVIVAADRLRRGRLRLHEPAILLGSAILGSGPFLFVVQPPAWFPVATTALVSNVTDLAGLAAEAESLARQTPDACVSTGVAALVPNSYAPGQVIGPETDLTACRTVLLFNHDLHYEILRPRVETWIAGPVIGHRIERYDQRPQR